MISESLLRVVQSYLHQLSMSGMRVAYGVVFGSQVRGNPNEWSDIDLVVVSDKFDQPYTRNDVQQL